MACIELATLNDTIMLGKWLADNLKKIDLPPVFLRGELGAGKTTLVKYIVESLPGAENAEVSSPSFNIYNIYPTNPRVAHCDLYRCGKACPDEILDALENRDILTIIEWADFFSPENFPPEFLDISFKIADYSRLLQVNATGQKPLDLLNNLETYWQSHIGSRK